MDEMNLNFKLKPRKDELLMKVARENYEVK